MRLFPLVVSLCITLSSLSFCSYAKVNLKEKLDQEQKQNPNLADVLKKTPSNDATVLPNGAVIDGTLYTLKMLLPSSSTEKMPSAMSKYSWKDASDKKPIINKNKNNKTKSKAEANKRK